MLQQHECFRILVIDDDKRILNSYRKILLGKPLRAATLERMLGEQGTDPFPLQLSVDFAQQGQEGLAMAREAMEQGMPYALAFVDGRMPPGWDGLETIRHLRALDPSLQVVFSSAYNDYSWARMKEQIGLDEGLLIIRKPFDRIEIQQSTLSLLEKWRLRRERELQRLS